MLKLNTNNFIFLALSMLVVTANVNGDFPNDPQPCKFKDFKCIGERIHYFVTTKFAGDKSINLGEFDPLKVPLMEINKGSESPVNIDLVLKNSIVTGLKHAKLIKITGFGSDMTEKHEVIFKIKSNVLVKGNYTINGKVIILPVVGNGDYEVNIGNATVGFRFNGSPQKRNGDTFMQIQNLSISINAKHAGFRFGNLFNGDKALGDSINAFVNENWSLIWDEIKANIANGMIPNVQRMLNDVFATFPYKDFFLKE